MTRPLYRPVRAHPGRAFAARGAPRPRPARAARALCAGAPSRYSRAMFRTILRVIRWLVFLAILGAFATYVWPTRFRYDHLTSDGNLVPVRIDRFTGDADMLVPDEGWIPVEGQDAGPGTAPASRRL